MIMLNYLDQTDLSPADFSFNPYLGESWRDRLRDVADAIVRRPIYKALHGKKFAHLSHPIDLVLPEKGMSILARRRWLNRYLPLKNSRILVMGCGSASDFGSYLHFKPKEIVGVDLYNFSNSWQQIQDYIHKNKLPTKVSFIQADCADISKVISGDFDIIASDDVLEHCRDLKSVLKTMYDLLRSGGLMYAGYGPLWYTWGGDHFSGRGGLEKGYNHLILNADAYRDYYEAYVQDDRTEVQNGGRYIKLDLFSKLSSREYFELYQDVGFIAKSTSVYFSRNAESLRNKELFNKALAKCPDKTVDDLIIKSHYVILAKP
jgi:SAM-dependent methyltransferase